MDQRYLHDPSYATSGAVVDKPKQKKSQASDMSQDKQQKREGFTDEELKGTWLAKVPLQWNPTAAFRGIVASEDLIEDKNVNKGRQWETDPHISVALKLGEPRRQRVEELQQSLNRDFGTQELQVDKLEAFKVLKGELKYDVLVALLQPNELLTSLNKLLWEEAKVTCPYSDGFRPHVTICYLKPGRGDKYTKDHQDSLALHKVTLPLERIVFQEFKKHDGLTHTIVLSKRPLA